MQLSAGKFRTSPSLDRDRFLDRRDYGMRYGRIPEIVHWDPSPGDSTSSHLSSIPSLPRISCRVLNQARPQSRIRTARIYTRRQGTPRRSATTQPGSKTLDVAAQSNVGLCIPRNVYSRFVPVPEPRSTQRIATCRAPPRATQSRFVIPDPR